MRLILRGTKWPRPAPWLGSIRPASTSSRPLKRNKTTLLCAASGLAVGFAVGTSFTLSRPDVQDALGSSIPRWLPSGSARSIAHHRKYADETTMLKAVEEIRLVLGEDAVSVDKYDVEEHSSSDWSTSNTNVRPVAVVRPQSTEDVSAIARICTRRRVPMIPYGAGSSLEGNFSSPFSGICIDLSGMDKIIALHREDLDVVVQPGINWMTLNDDIKDSGLFLPPDPSPTALVGGMISTNCSGTNATRYGTMRDYVVNLTVVLADGSVIKTRRRPRKTSAGYNLNGLFAGAEGTLGIITEVTLKLAILPRTQSVATVTFENLKQAASAACVMVRSGVPLGAVELMDEVQMQIINKNGGAGGRLWKELPTLFIKFAGTEATVKDNIKSVREMAKSFDCDSFEFATGPKQMDALWSARKQVLWASLAVKPEGTRVWSTDVAVPLSRLADLIEICRDRASKLGLFTSILGHVGDGNFHQMFMYNPEIPEQANAVEDCVNLMVDDALAMDGTVTGEHGIGLGKKHSLAKELDGPTLGVMKALKDSLDPHWLLNPGKIFDEIAIRARYQSESDFVEYLITCMVTNE